MSAANKDWDKNTNKWTKLGAEAIGIGTKKVKISNHSNRSTTVSQLSSADTSVK
jgi:hypothetical protein